MNLSALPTTILLASLATPASAQDVWVLETEQARCFIENIEKYQSATAQPVVIFLSACPIVNVAKAMKQLQVNSGVQPGTQTKNGDVDDVIVYTLKELMCLDKLSIASDEPFVLLPKRPCAAQ